MRVHRCLLVMALALVATALPVRAQITSGVQGTVTDPAGLVVPDARIVVKNLATSSTWQASTNAEGFYHISGLPAGTYSVVGANSCGTASAQVTVTVVAVNVWPAMTGSTPFTGRMRGKSSC